MDKTIQIPLPSKLEMIKRVGDQWYINHYPEFVDMINKIYPVEYSLKEKIYSYLNGIHNRPLCKTCGKPVSFRNPSYGYNEYCSTKCVSHSKEVKEKVIKTKEVRYGDARYNNREKYKETCLEKYGVSNSFSSEECKQKIKNTLVERYGVEYAQQSLQIQEKRKKNSLEKYGVDHHMKVDDIRAKISKSNQLHILESHDFLIGYTEDNHWICRCPHEECSKCLDKFYIIPSDNYYARLQHQIEPCTNLHPLQWGRKNGTLLEKFIRNILDEYHIEYIVNDRRVLKDLELDIYIPSHNLAIECNGIFWHSHQHHKPIRYHINKYRRCDELNIQLLTFWEDQIKIHPDIVKSILLSKLNIYQHRIYARNCTVQHISPHECVNFLKTNHIQGRTNSTVRLGLYQGDVLVSVMTFTKKKNKSYELSRFCNQIYTTVIGGASKLLSYFIKHYYPHEIISFASNDISDGSLYRKLGFETNHTISTSYWYIHKKDLKRYHRSNFSKNRLKALGYDVEDKSENDIMNELPYWKIYDCGHIKYVLNI